MNNNDNQIRRFPCSHCNKLKLVLKKVADQQKHGFACEECWTTIQTPTMQCSIS